MQSATRTAAIDAPRCGPRTFVGLARTRGCDDDSTRMGAGFSILVVDDDGDVRSTIAEVLREEGYTVHEAADGREALDKLASLEKLPDLILLDLMMPQMNGWEFRRWQLEDARLAAVRVVVISAFSPSASGMSRDLFRDIPRLQKPVKLTTLLEVVEQCAR